MAAIPFVGHVNRHVTQSSDITTIPVTLNTGRHRKTQEGTGRHRNTPEDTGRHRKIHRKTPEDTPKIIFYIYELCAIDNEIIDKCVKNTKRLLKIQGIIGNN